MMLTHARLLEVLHYDPETGVFTWRVTRQGCWAGDTAGRDCQGYVRIGIDGQDYYAHRLAWFYEYGEWPKTRLDHRDTDRANNRLSNLRPATLSQNAANQKKRADSSSRYKGVWCVNGRWRARVKLHGRSRYLGTFDSEENAHDAYCNAAAEAFGEFARP